MARICAIGSGIEVLQATDNADEALTALVGVKAVGANEVVVVAHVVIGSDLDESSHGESKVTPQDRIIRQIRDWAERLRSEVKALSTEHWLVVGVGDAISESEQALIEDALEEPCAAVLVAATATSTSVAHDPNDQLCFLADAVVAALSDDLSTGISTGSTNVWGVGIASASYSADRRVTRETLITIVPEVQEVVLARPDEAACRRLGTQTGENLVPVLCRKALLVGPDGLPSSHLLGPGLQDFDEVDIDDWAAKLSNSVDVARQFGVPTAKHAVDHQAIAAFQLAARSISEKAIDHVRDDGSLRSVMPFLEGVEDALTKHDSQQENNAPGPVDRDAKQAIQRLPAMLRNRPGRLGTATRVAALSGVTLQLFTATALTANFMVGGVLPLPWAAFGAVSAAGAGWYRSRMKSIQRTRDRALKAAEDELRTTIETYAHQQANEILSDLLIWLRGDSEGVPGGLMGVYAATITNHEQLASTPTGEPRTDFITSTHAIDIDVPFEPPLDGSGLDAIQVTDHLVTLLRSWDWEHPEATPLDRLTAHWASVALPNLSPRPESLAQVIDDDKTVAEELARHLSADLAPAVKIGFPITDEPTVSRYLLYPKGSEKSADQLKELAPGSTSFASLTSSFGWPAEGFAMLHLKPLSQRADPQ